MRLTFLFNFLLNLLFSGILVLALLLLLVFQMLKSPLYMRLLQMDSKMDRLPFDSETGTGTWDNIHWWGYRGDGKPLISTPGAFYAAHLHWRWSTVVQSPSGVPLLDSPHAGEDQFIGVDLEGTDLGGPLLDPEIPKQSIKFAVTKYDKNKDPNEKDVHLKDLSGIRFEDTFIEKEEAKDPKYIEKGADIVLWYSVEVHKEESKNFEGTIFIHGMFFAHDSEQTWAFSSPERFIGETEPTHIPGRPDQQWIRNPKRSS